MNNVECMLSTREQTRTEYRREFLKDLGRQGAQHGHDPRNTIGLGCGISVGRAHEILFRRLFNA